MKDILWKTIIASITEMSQERNWKLFNLMSICTYSSGVKNSYIKLWMPTIFLGSPPHNGVWATV